MLSKPCKNRPELAALLRKAVTDFAAMPPDEQERPLRQQREGWVKAEMSWPKDCPYR